MVATRVAARVAAAVHCLSLIGCDRLKWHLDAELRREFTDSLRNERQWLRDGGTLDLAKVTAFDWDRVHVFLPYTPHGMPERVVGADVYVESVPTDTVNLF